MVVAPGTLTGTLTVQRTDSVGNTVATVGDLAVLLTSTSGTGVFYQNDGITVITGGCTKIADTGSQLTFKYKDTAAGTPTLTAADNSLATCLGSDEALTNADFDVSIQLAAVAVTIAGVNLAPNLADLTVLPTVTWDGEDIPHVTLCVKGVAAPDGCISKFTDKSVTILTPFGEVGDTATVTVNGGGAIASDKFEAKYYYGPHVTGMKGKTGQAGPVAGGSALTVSGAGFGTSKTVPPTIQWGDDQQISTPCFDPVTKLPNPGTATGTQSCISKWSATSVTVLTPPLASITPDDTSGTNARVAVGVIPTGSDDPAPVRTSVDTNFYYGSLVTAIKNQAGSTFGGTAVSIAGAGLLANPLAPPVFPSTTNLPTVNWGSHPINQWCDKAAVAPIVSDCISKATVKGVTVLAPTEILAGGSGPFAITVNSGYAKDNIDNNFYFGALVTAFKGQASRGTVTPSTAMTISGIGFGTDKLVPPVVQWGDDQQITAKCVDGLTVLTSNCISKWSNTSVSVLTPLLSLPVVFDDTTDGGGSVAVTVIPTGASAAPALSSMDNNYFYGSLVTGMKPL